MAEPYLNQTILQDLVTVRLEETQALLAAGLFSGAYYLAGYAVECGLKACVAKKTRQGDFPSRERAQQSYKHRATELRGAAELMTQWSAAKDADPRFEIYWKVVSDWCSGG